MLYCTFKHYHFDSYALLCSKLETAALKGGHHQVVADAKEKNRKFTETVELQIGLKNYDPQKQAFQRLYMI